jgi:hypothetical protein
LLEKVTLLAADTAVVGVRVLPDVHLRDVARFSKLPKARAGSLGISTLTFEIKQSEQLPLNALALLPTLFGNHSLLPPHCLWDSNCPR